MRRLRYFDDVRAWIERQRSPDLRFRQDAAVELNLNWWRRGVRGRPNDHRGDASLERRNALACERAPIGAASLVGCDGDILELAQRGRDAALTLVANRERQQGASCRIELLALLELRARLDVPLRVERCLALREESISARSPCFRLRCRTLGHMEYDEDTEDAKPSKCAAPASFRCHETRVPHPPTDFYAVSRHRYRNGPVHHGRAWHGGARFSH